MTMKSCSPRGMGIVELAVTALLLLLAATVAVKILALVFGMAVGMVSAVVGTLIYFLPAFLARGKKSFFPILMVNIFLGWSGVGWLVALIWSLGADGRQSRPPSAE